MQSGQDFAHAMIACVNIYQIWSSVFMLDTIEIHVITLLKSTVLERDQYKAIFCMLQGNYEHVAANLWVN